MGDQTESTRGGSAARRGAAVAVVAVAPRPGLALRGACPPLTAAEAAGLQTAWLKQVAQELPGATVHLFGRPADALPMLRYFAGPGVELREWQAAGDGPPTRAELQQVAERLLAEGHAPVLARTADAPDTDPALLLACLEAARTDAVLGRDQCGAAWLVGGPDAAAFARAAAPRLAPWARTVRNHDDLLLLWRERARGGDEADRTATLPVRDLQAALRWYETVLGAELLADDGDRATLAGRHGRLQLAARGPGHRPNGLLLPCADPVALAAELAPHGAVRTGDEPAPRIGGGTAFTATDDSGNRLTFAEPGFAR